MFKTCVSDAIKLVGESIHTSVVKRLVQARLRGALIGAMTRLRPAALFFYIASRISFAKFDSGVVDATVCVLRSSERVVVCCVFSL